MGRERRRFSRNPTKKMNAIIAKLAQMPIAALLPSVRPVDVLGTAPVPDAVELSFELTVASVGGEVELDGMVDEPLLDGFSCSG